MYTPTQRKLANQINDPAEYQKLSTDQQEVLQQWIQQHIVPFKQKTFSGPSSYWIKHHFERTRTGFYITNGQMKGAMAAAGFKPKDISTKNWQFQLSCKVQKLNVVTN